MPKAREDAGNQVVIGFRFGSDWLGEWCEFSGKITTKAKLMQSRITLDTLLKVALCQKHFAITPFPLPH